MKVSSNFLKISKKVLKFQELGVGLALVILSLILGFTTENFFNLNNLIAILRQSVFIGVMALGMVFVLSSRDVDLSVGGIYNVSGIITAFFIFKGFPILVAVLAGLCAGILCGLLNISLALIFKIPTIIITLGTMGIFKAFGLVICQSKQIYDFPKDSIFFTVIGTKIGPIPTGVIILILLTIVLSLVYGFTLFGNRVRGIGSNPEAARFSGINIAKYRVIVFMLMGALAATAGILEVSFLQLSNPSMGSGTELMVIAAAIIGGTALSGGTGSILGALIGTLIIMVVRNGIVQLGVSPYWSSAVTGIVIIAAVAVDYLFRKGRNLI
jgi:ribose transport system permease protein